MLQRMNRVLALLIVCGAICMATIYAAAGGDGVASLSLTASAESAAAVPGWSEHADEAITLDWYINYSWFTTGWGQNAVSQKITEETGVTVNFITPAGTETEKLAAMISADSLPDLITLGWWETQLDEMIAKDIVYALNELAEEYEPYFFTVADDEVIAWYQNEDGNL